MDRLSRGKERVLGNEEEKELGHISSCCYGKIHNLVSFGGAAFEIVGYTNTLSAKVSKEANRKCIQISTRFRQITRTKTVVLCLYKQL